MTHRNFKEESKDKNWGTEVAEGRNLNTDQIRLGAELRMADSLELIAKDKQRLEADKKYYYDLYIRYRNLYLRECKKASTLKGHITRLKKQRDQE